MNRDLRQRNVRWLVLVQNRKSAVAAVFATRSSQTKALTMLTCFLPIMNEVIIWRSSVGKHLRTSSYQSIRHTHTAGLPACLRPLWATIIVVFLYHNEPQFSPLYDTKGPVC